MASFSAVAAWASVISSVVSLAISLTMDTKGKQKDSGNNIDRKGSDNPKIVPFGKCVVPAVRVWNNVNNNNSKYLAQSYSLGVGQLKDIKEVFIDGVPCFDGDHLGFDVWYTPNKEVGEEGSTSYHFKEFPNLAMGFRAGKNTEQPWKHLIENGDGEYTDTSRGDRTGSIGMLIERRLPEGKDNDVRIMSDNIRVEALIEGNPVIDFRYDTTLEGITDNTKRTWVNGNSASFRNPSCVVFTYLVDGYYGVGIPVDAIDLDSFIELANYCEQSNLSFDGYVDQNQDFGQILLDMVTSFDGVLFVEDGLIKVRPDRASFPVCHITEDDLVGSFKLSNANDSNYYNVINAEFVNIDSNYSGDKYVLPSNIYEDEQIKIDGFEKSKTFKYPYTCDDSNHTIIKILANKALKQARFQKTIEFDLDNSKQEVQINDVIEVSNDAYKLDRIKFRVNKIATTLDDKTMVSKITATEYSDTVYDETSYEDGITSGKPSTPSVIVPTPANLTFEQQGFGKTGKGVLSWTTRYNRECRTIVECKLSSASAWKRLGEVKADSYDLDGLRSDAYDFRVLTVSYLGSTSEWVVLSNVQVVGANALPPVNNLTASFTGRDCLVNWSYDKSLELEVDTVGDLFSHYEVAVYKGGVYSETVATSNPSLNYTFEDNIKTGVNRNLRFDVKVVSIHNLGSSVVSVIATNSQITQPSGVVVSGKLVQLTVKWDDPAESVSDYSGTEIHISSNGNFTPNSNTLIAISKSPVVQITEDYKTTHYVRVGHYDLFGRDGISYSSPVAFDTLDIDDLLTDSPAWGSVNVNLEQLDKVVAQLDRDVIQIDKDIDKAEADIRTNATKINQLNTTVGSQGALISSNAEAIESTNGNLATYKTQVASEFQGVKTNISTNTSAISTTDKALTAYKTEVTGKFADSESKITTAQNTANTANSALASYKTEVANSFKDSNSKITTAQNTANTANQAVAALDSKLTAELNTAKAGISSNQTAIANTNSALASYKTEVASAFKDANSKITTAQNTANTATSSIASLDTRLSAEIGGVKGSISSTNSVVAGVDGKVNALNQTMIEVNGKTSGLIMGNNGVTSTTDVIADRFRVSSAAGSQAVFEVNSASGEVLMKNALIKNLTATNISAGAITGSHIASNTKVIAGSGTKSATLDGADPTWGLYAGHSDGNHAPFRVSKSGQAFMTNAEISGKITASSGSIGSVQIGSSGSLQTGVFIEGDTIIVKENGAIRVKIGRLH
ncbi:hypothetical protein RA178_06325 [Shewanella oncorhynchi]|uniref:Chromosome partition protein Smc n=1 Tax=Shewanella oncorhynchi TaxID=2726434 RepID=A0AA50Q7L8_9GAMM|nr:hypothetical protein [Shewanella oncorhynchi]WMB74228.1 hypothetical protein RA178_06325 [Shewanella oncorhynchi]